jgi:hypothetical protein
MGNTCTYLLVAEAHLRARQIVISFIINSAISICRLGGFGGYAAFPALHADNTCNYDPREVGNLIQRSYIDCTRRNGRVKVLSNKFP